MSATLRHPPAPFIAPVSGTIEQRLAQIADALNGKASATGATAFPFIGLIDSSGAMWKLTVDTSGALHTEAVAR